MSGFQPGELSLDDVHAVVIGSNVSTSGSIRFGGGGAQASASASASSAADVLDRVQRATVWSQRTCEHVCTLCLGRIERLGSLVALRVRLDHKTTEVRQLRINLCCFGAPPILRCGAARVRINAAQDV